MKKVLILAAVVVLFAAPAMAGIANSKHDLSSGNTGIGATVSNTNEICVFCHTPHGAQTAGPLWNKNTIGAMSITKAYGDPSGTIDAVTMDVTGIEGSDAPLCLTCHDGSSLTDLTNPPNSLGATALAITTNGGGVLLGKIAGDALLDGDFSNDHPVGFSYVDGSDAEIYDRSAIEGTLGLGAISFGSLNDEMWCSSCHDVHDGSNSAFLHISNTGSALCLACHNK